MEKIILSGFLPLPALHQKTGFTLLHHGVWFLPPLGRKSNLNDRRKWKLAEKNHVRCLIMMKGIMERLSNRKWRGLLGRFLFGLKEQNI